MSKPSFLFAPGAGAPSSHPWMRRWSELLNTIGAVWTFDYPYMIEGRRRPDHLQKLIAAHREALAQALQTHRGPAVLIGKSMGSRIGCHLALEQEVAALICLSYPLCGGGDREKLRDKVLRELSTPILSVQGTRDPLCPLDLLDRVRREMTAVNETHIVEGADHSLLVTKGQLKGCAETQNDVDLRIVRAIQQFVADHATNAGA